MMVLGFLAAMALLSGLGRVTGSVFSAFGFARLGEGFLGVSGFLAFSVILGSCAIGAAWKLFGLAAGLPDRVLSWVGAGGGGGGEAEEARRGQASFQAAGSLGTRMLEPLALRREGSPRPPGGPKP
jgi:hypothetical protein